MCMPVCMPACSSLTSTIPLPVGPAPHVPTKEEEVKSGIFSHRKLLIPTHGRQPSPKDIAVSKPGRGKCPSQKQMRVSSLLNYSPKSPWKCQARVEMVTNTPCFEMPQGGYESLTFHTFMPRFLPKAEDGIGQAKPGAGDVVGETEPGRCWIEHCSWVRSPNPVHPSIVSSYFIHKTQIQGWNYSQF